MTVTERIRSAKGQELKKAFETALETPGIDAEVLENTRRAFIEYVCEEEEGNGHTS